MSAAAAVRASPPGRTVLAFDFGTRRIGVAVGDTETRLANPLGVIAGANDAARLARIEALVREWRPERLVVGLPLAADGGEHAVTRAARRFARRLAARFGLPVEFCDERLSSAAAEETLRQTGRNPRRHRHDLDAFAASVILQSWLDESARG